MIRFTLPKGVSETEFMKALSCMVYPYSGGFKWFHNITDNTYTNPSNDFVLAENDGIWSLSYRYEMDEEIAALKVMLSWRLGATIIEETSR